MDIEEFAKNNICHFCVIISIAKADSDTSRSSIYARKLDSDFGGEGHPFQLERYDVDRNTFNPLWENQKITKEKLEVGSIARCVQAGNEFIYYEKTAHRRQVS